MKLVNSYWFPDSDNQCSAAVFKEVYKIKIISDYCTNKRTVLQAGGNVGLFPAELSSIFNKVITFEPDTENYACLEKNINEIENIEYHKMGLSNMIGEGFIYQPEHLDNCGSLAIKESLDGDIDLINIDSMFLEDLDLIYLDIEGAEYKAIKGAADTISRCKPVIALENKGLIPGFGDGGFNGSNRLRSWICSLGYKYEKRLMRDDVFIPV